MAKLLNHSEAVTFLNSIGDPVVRGVMQHAHALIYRRAPPSCGQPFFGRAFASHTSDLLVYAAIDDSSFG
jgi:hypothetical protein